MSSRLKYRKSQAQVMKVKLWTVVMKEPMSVMHRLVLTMFQLSMIPTHTIILTMYQCNKMLRWNFVTKLRTSKSTQVDIVGISIGHH
jgi:hypothetical protein